MKISILFLTYFLINSTLLKAPLFGFSLFYFGILIKINNSVILKKSTKILVGILFTLLIFLSLSIIFQSDFTFWSRNPKIPVILFSSIFYTSIISTASAESNAKSIRSLIYFLFFVLILSYPFRNLGIFQYDRSFGIIGLFPLYLTTDTISYIGFSSDPNQFLALIFLLATIFVDIFTQRTLLMLLILAIAAKSSTFILISVALIAYGLLPKQKYKEIVNKYALVLTTLVLFATFAVIDNIRTHIWLRYSTYIVENLSWTGYPASTVDYLYEIMRSPHNTLLDIYLHLGVLGLLGFIALIIVSILERPFFQFRFCIIILSLLNISLLGTPAFYIFIITLFLRKGSASSPQNMISL